MLYQQKQIVIHTIPWRYTTSFLIAYTICELDTIMGNTIENTVELPNEGQNGNTGFVHC